MPRFLLSWTAGAILLATTGSPAARAQVRLNEVMANNLSIVTADGSVTDWVELENRSATAVDLSDASLTDDPADPRKWVFPFGVSIPGNGRLVVNFDLERSASFEAERHLNTGFNLSAGGDVLLLFEAGFTGVVLDSVTFGMQAVDFSIARDAAGAWALSIPTPGAANTPAGTGAVTGLRVNEWLANAPNGVDDWFELYNTNSLPVALGGLFLTDDLANRVKSPIPPLSFIGAGAGGFAQFIADGNTNKGAEHVAFSLRGAGEEIAIFDARGTRLDAITFGAQALEVSEGRLPDGAAFITTFPGTASPGDANFKAIPSIIVSELLAHTDPPLEDAVEFYNSSDAAINIGGWFLSNKRSDLQRFLIPAGTLIPAKGFKVFYENEFNFTNPRVPFTFNSAHGDQVYLAQTDAEGRLTGYRAGEEFEASQNGVSFIHHQTSVAGDYKFVASTRHTFGVSNPASVEEFRTGQGAPNAGPRVGPVILNEVHYNPFSPDGFDNTIDEYIELHNPTGEPVLFYDPLHPENRWRLQNGVSFTFPTGTVMPAFGYFLILSFDPDFDPIGAANFRAFFNVPANVPLFGPFRGDLNNNGDSLELYRPDPPQGIDRPDAGFVPYIRVDKINYTDAAPWPTGADGTGLSLQRKNASAFGNDPIAWETAAITPGRGNSPAVQDTDGDGMPDLWEDQFSFDKTNASDAALDTDRDGFTNLQEYIAGTDPRNATSRLKIDRLIPAQGELTPLRIIFTAQANKSYSVLYRNSFAVNSVWQKLEDIPAESTSHQATVEDPRAYLRTDRYYQLITPAN